MTPVPPHHPKTKRRRRAMAHQCPACRKPWSLRVHMHSAGDVIICSHCGEIRGVSKTRLRLAAGE